MRHRITFKQLQNYASSHGYMVEKVRGKIEWNREDNHSIVGVCDTVCQAYGEIAAEIENKGS